ncbi:MAG: flavodoxin family protein [Elusimicrobia bacterium]|nr:flavodoxin family protein [Elusimicrobiota bacterium]
MKLLLISSSPRMAHSNTFLLAKEVLKGAAGPDVTSEIIHLSGLKIKFCAECGKCHKKIMGCPIKDDANNILEKMLKADGIIIASPNYINQVTASMKALFDRSSHFIHCKRLLDKYIAGAVSSGSGRDTEVVDYVGHYANVCGAQYCGGVSSRAMTVNEKMKEAFELGKTLASDIRKKKAYPGQKKAIENAKKYFGAIIKARKKDWAGEYQYWRKKGWL